MVREIIKYPDKRLYQRSTPIIKFDGALGGILDDMYETMIARKGIGLAAIQIGLPLRAIVINLVSEDGTQKPEEKYELINPEFITRDGETTYEEGCLSVPGYYEEVKRAEKIEISYMDRTGAAHTLAAEGLLAICIQHEMDHLDGHLFIERLSYTVRKKFEKEYRKKR